MAVDSDISRLFEAVLAQLPSLLDVPADAVPLGEHLAHYSVLYRLLQSWELQGAMCPFSFADVAAHVGTDPATAIEAWQGLLGPLWDRYFPHACAGTATSVVLPRQAVLLSLRVLERAYGPPQAPSPEQQRADEDAYKQFIAKRQRVCVA